MRLNLQVNPAAPALLELPPSTQLYFLAEGGANIVYRFTLPSDPTLSSDNAFALDVEDRSNTPPPTELEPLMYDPILDGKLLRLRKAVGWATTQVQNIQDLRETFLTLFDANNLMSYHLVRLPEGLIAKGNAGLRAYESTGKRAVRRCGTYLEEKEPYGMLVTDMSADSSKGEVLLEFKPKWLAQSPTAPVQAKRCRTCALKAWRRAQKQVNAGAGDVPWCPLALVGRPKQVAEVIGALMLAESGNAKIEVLRGRLEEFLVAREGAGLLQKLKHLQEAGDPFGILDANRTDPWSKEFLTAMTLRDCTLFLRISENCIEAKLGDLDSKTPNAGKLEYWRCLEKVLIQEGWYMGEEKEKQANDCLLNTR